MGKEISFCIIIILNYTSAVRAAPSPPSPAASALASGIIFTKLSDATTVGEDPKLNCTTGPYTTKSIGINGDFDFITVGTDKWNSGGLLFGCMAQTNYVCTKSCFPFKTQYPNFSNYAAITFLAKVKGDLNGITCNPSLGMTSSDWPRKSSKNILLKGGYADYGTLSSSEWRRVVIPIQALKSSDWNITNVYGLYFNSCGTNHSTAQPTYWITAIQVTNSPPPLIATTKPVTAKPSASPVISPLVSGIIFTKLSDAVTVGEDPKLNCTTGPYTTKSIGINGDFDFITVGTDKWNSGGLIFGCMAQTNYACTKSCFPFNMQYPNFSNYAAITFLAKVTGDLNGITCNPSLGMTSSDWPRKSSKNILLKGGYADYGTLSSSEWRRVVIPIQALKSSGWNITNVYGLYFNSCGTNHSTAQPTYWITAIQVTNSPPPLIATTKPVTAKPRASPIISPLVSGIIFTKLSDTVTVGEDPKLNCTSGPYTTRSIGINGDFDFITVGTDMWNGGGLLFGCMAQTNYACTKSCFPFNMQYPNFSNYAAITFLAKVTGDLNGITCNPAFHMTSSDWPRKSSNGILLIGQYVDSGALSSSEWRRVVIPIQALKTSDWNITNVYGIYFDSCGLHSANPTYFVTAIQVTNNPPLLLSMSPTSSPKPALANQRMINNFWYPILSPTRGSSTWITASDNQWPNVPTDGSSYQYSVHIPFGSIVTYSASSNLQLDKIIVEGSLIIVPAYGNVTLICSTLVVEKGGILEVGTLGSSYTVTIQFDGRLDHETDPMETMVGLVSLGGHVTFCGEPVASKMGELRRTILPYSDMLVVAGDSGASNWSPGDELVLPDTQKGLHTAHWNFPAVDGFRVPGQTEFVTIKAIETIGTETFITLTAPVKFSHDAGCHAAHITRSITIETAKGSADRGHILHTAGGKFDIMNTRIQGMGRTNISLHDNTALQNSGVRCGAGLALMSVAYQGSNQMGRYAIHAHHSTVSLVWSGNAIVGSPRNGVVAHNSRVEISNNIVVGAEGSAIFLEAGTETGMVQNNFVVGTGGGTRGGDDGRFSSSNGTDMGAGGFGIWCRGGLAPIINNYAEGTFGRSPYAFFVHSNFNAYFIVPNVTGTNPKLSGKTLHEIGYLQPVSLQTYGGFIDNYARGSWIDALDLNYFTHFGEGLGHELVRFNFTAFAASGMGLFTIHSSTFVLINGYMKAVMEGNTIVGVYCNNGALHIINDNTTFEGVAIVRGGNC